LTTLKSGDNIRNITNTTLKGGKRMKINRKKLELAKARACMGQKEIVAAGFPAGTLTNAMTGKNIKPETAGRLAKVLGVDVLEIIETEE
jgi:hypothetical protein